MPRRFAIAALAGMSMLSGLTLVVPPRLAFADAISGRSARQHFRQGEGHYAAGKYEAALAEYQAGYEVEPLPGFLVNIAQCQRRLGDLKRARATYGKFLLVAPDSPLAPEVRGLVEELNRQIADTAAADPGASSTTHGEGGLGSSRRLATMFDPSSPTVLVAPREVAGGPAANPPGADLTTGSDVMPPSDVAEQSVPTTSGSSHRWWLWGSIAAVAVGAATAAVILSAAPEATTIHEGSLGTLRR